LKVEKMATEGTKATSKSNKNAPGQHTLIMDGGIRYKGPVKA